LVNILCLINIIFLYQGPFRTSMGSCLQAGKLSLYVTIHQVNSDFHISWVVKSSTGLSICGWVGAHWLLLSGRWH